MRLRRPTPRFVAVALGTALGIAPCPRDALRVAAAAAAARMADAAAMRAPVAAVAPVPAPPAPAAAAPAAGEESLLDFLTGAGAAQRPPAGDAPSSA